LRPPGAAPGFRHYKSPRMTVILRALRVLFLFLVLLSYYLFPGGVVLELHQTVFKTTDSLRLSPPALRIPGAAPGLGLYKNPRLTVILYALGCCSCF